MDDRPKRRRVMRRPRRPTVALDRVTERLETRDGGDDLARGRRRGFGGSFGGTFGVDARRAWARGDDAVAVGDDG
jgi:hypothetical protein